MKKSKLFLFGLSLIFSFNSICLVYANENTISENSISVNNTIDEISSEYKLKDISIKDIPEGVIPIEVSAEELESKILEIENDIKSDLNSYYSNSNNYCTENNKFRTAGTYTQVFAAQVGALCRAKLTTKITESNTRITNVTTPNVTLSGFTYSMDLTNVSTSSYIYNNGKNADIDANYQIDSYLFISSLGLVKVLSTNVSQGFTYELDKGIISHYLDVL